MTLSRHLVAFVMAAQTIDAAFDAVIWSGEGKTILWWGTAVLAVPAYAWAAKAAWHGRIA